MEDYQILNKEEREGSLVEAPTQLGSLRKALQGLGILLLCSLAGSSGAGHARPLTSYTPCAKRSFRRTVMDAPPLFRVTVAPVSSSNQCMDGLGVSAHLLGMGGNGREKVCLLNYFSC